MLSFEVKSFVEDWPKIKQQLEPKVARLQEFIHEKTGLPVQAEIQKLSAPMMGGNSTDDQGRQHNYQQNQQQKLLQSQGEGQQQEQEPTAQGQQQEQSQKSVQKQQGGQSEQSGSGGVLSAAGSFIMKFFGFLGTALLTLVYIFFFLLYRNKFRKSIVRMVPADRQEDTNAVISNAVKVSQNYLLGKLILCVIIAVFYAIGLTVSGVKHAILVAALASLLTLIPYLGNIIGFFLALGMAFFSGSSTTALIGVAATFGITQFLETYTLEPYVVGDKVNLNPIFTIIVVVLGNAVWGVVGMLISIPALGIAKVIFDHVGPLNSLGYMIGQEDMDDDHEDSNNIFSRMKHWALSQSKSSQ